MRLALAAALALAAPAFAGVLPSGLADPLASAATCEAFASEVELGGEADLQSIAFAEGRMAHGVHTPEAETATDLLFARSAGTLSMSDGAVSVYINVVCRSL